jgi:hypothetical protein
LADGRMDTHTTPRGRLSRCPGPAPLRGHLQATTGAAAADARPTVPLRFKVADAGHESRGLPPRLPVAGDQAQKDHLPVGWIDPACGGEPPCTPTRSSTSSSMAHLATLRPGSDGSRTGHFRARGMRAAIQPATVRLRAQRKSMLSDPVNRREHRACSH